MSNLRLFTSKAEKLVHELKEVKTVQKVLQFNIERIQEIQMKYDRKTKELEHQMDQYIVSLFNPKEENENGD